MARNSRSAVTYTVTIVTRCRINPATGEVLETFATPGMPCTEVQLRAAWEDVSTVAIGCDQCGEDQDWCPDLRRILGTDHDVVRHTGGLVAIG